MADTREEVLSAVQSWIIGKLVQGKTGSSTLFSIRKALVILWMSGLAGTGKTTIAHTIASWCDSLGLLGASFFCARVGGRSVIHRIFPTIAHQLSVSNSAFANEVMKALSAHPDIHRSQPLKQLEKLIVEPLRALKDASLLPQVVVIDALDECHDEEAVSVILAALSQFVADIHPLKFIITSRPESRIVKGFRFQTLLENTHPFPLNEVPRETVEHDMAVYVEERLKSIREYYSIDASWPTDAEKKQLVFLAHGLFIFLATALKFIADVKRRDPRARLAIVLQMLGKHKGDPLAYLYGLYDDVFDDVISDDTEPEMVAELKTVVGSVVLLRDQLSPSALDSLLGVEAGTTTRYLELFSSIISLPPTEEGVIQIIHPSFPDFLVDPTKCTKHDLAVQPRKLHGMLAKRCLETMTGVLCRNICRIPPDQVSFPNRDISDLAVRIRNHLPSHVRYALRHWAHHLRDSEMETETVDLLKTVCHKHLPHWLESLSLMGDTNITVDILQVARRALIVRHCTISQV